MRDGFITHHELFQKNVFKIIFHLFISLSIKLQDNLMLRRKEAEVEKTNDALKVEQDKLGGIDVRNLVQEERKLRLEKEKMEKEVSTAKHEIIAWN